MTMENFCVSFEFPRRIPRGGASFFKNVDKNPNNRVFYFSEPKKGD